MLRHYFDEKMRPMMALDDSQVEVNFTTEAGNIMDSKYEIPDEIMASIRDMFKIAQEEIHNSLLPRYELSLVKIIGNALEEIEKHLKANFTDLELTEIASIIEKDSVKKLLSSFVLVDNIQKHCQDLYLEMQEHFNDICANSNLNERMTNIIGDLLKKQGFDGHFQVTHDFLPGNSPSSEEKDFFDDDEKDSLEGDDEDISF